MNPSVFPVSTSTDGFVATVIGLEIGGEFFELGLAFLSGNDSLFGKDDGLRPLSHH